MGGRLVIVLDTHVWVWWVNGGSPLPVRFGEYLRQNEETGLGISAISCWEIAKLVQVNRLLLPMPVEQWLAHALRYPGIQLLPLTPHIAVDSARLPGDFHRDPADQIIVATARVHGCPLVTVDKRILNYPHVQKGP